MTSESVRRVGVPLAIAVAVLALVLGVIRLVDPPGDGVGGSVVGSPGSGGGGADSGGRDEPGSSGSAVAPTADPGDQPGTDPDAPMSRFTSVTAGADGTSLVVAFWGGVEDCYRYSVIAREADASVTLSLRETSTFDGACIDLAQEYERSVVLDAPLGTRVVLDAVTDDQLLAPSP